MHRWRPFRAETKVIAVTCAKINQSITFMYPRLQRQEIIIIEASVSELRCAAHSIFRSISDRFYLNTDDEADRLQNNF